jgi:hypothetical protein
MIKSGECVVTQHKLLVANFRFQVCVDKIEARKSRERSGGSSKGTFLKCLRIKLLHKGRGTQVRMQIVCERR